MAVPKKGWRKITLGEAEYFWRVRGTDWGLDVVIITAVAFEPGGSGQKLTFQLGYDERRENQGEGVISLTQRAVVSPGVIRAAIERARTLDPPFTGGRGLGNCTLPAKTVAELQVAGRVDETK